MLFALTTAVPTAARAAETPACAGRLYTVDSYSDDVSVIDTVINQVIATIPVGKAPGWAAFTPDKKQLYVTNSQAASISVIDVATNTVVRTISTDVGPIGVTFTPDGTRLIVSYLPGQVRIFTLATGAVSPPISVGLDPEQIRITADGKFLYVASTLQGIYKIDVDHARIVTTIPIKDPNGGPIPFPYNLTLAPDGRTLYVAAIFGDFIAAIDTGSDTVVHTWPAHAPVGLQTSSDGRRLYVTNFWNATATEYDIATGSVLRTSAATDISLPSQAAESADGQYLYFGQSFDTKLLVFSTSTWKPVKTLTVGSGPNSLAICDSASPR